jgi:acyl carrier protein
MNDTLPATNPAGQVLAEALQIDVSEVNQEMALGVTERWDSLAHMRLIMALEEQLGRPIETEEMLSVEDIPSIQALLEQG